MSLTTSTNRRPPSNCSKPASTTSVPSDTNRCTRSSNDTSPENGDVPSLAGTFAGSNTPTRGRSTNTLNLLPRASTAFNRDVSPRIDAAENNVVVVFIVVAAAAVPASLERTVIPSSLGLGVSHPTSAASTEIETVGWTRLTIARAGLMRDGDTATRSEGTVSAVSTAGRTNRRTPVSLWPLPLPLPLPAFACGPRRGEDDFMLDVHVDLCRAPPTDALARSLRSTLYTLRSTLYALCSLAQMGTTRMPQGSSGGSNQLPPRTLESDEPPPTQLEHLLPHRSLFF